MKNLLLVEVSDEVYAQLKKLGTPIASMSMTHLETLSALKDLSKEAGTVHAELEPLFGVEMFSAREVATTASLLRTGKMVPPIHSADPYTIGQLFGRIKDVVSPDGSVLRKIVRPGKSSFWRIEKA